MFSLLPLPLAKRQDKVHYTKYISFGGGITMLDSLEIITLVEDSVPMNGSFVGEHGLSFLISGKRNGKEVRGLLDVGQSPEVLSHNMKGLGISPGSIDFLVLSHCHYDHTGGAARFVASTGKKNFPVVAHPSIFRSHFKADPVLTSKGIQTGDEREAIEKAGGKLFLSSDPFPLAEGIATTGEIPRETDFEGPGKAFLTLQDGKVAVDTLPDDMGITARVRGKGIVVIAGCSHSGIVNILRRVQSLYPEEPIEGVIGGLHLVNATEEKMEKTLAGIREISPGWVAAGHCTGFPMQVKLSLSLGSGFSPLCVGKRFLVEGDPGKE